MTSLTTEFGERVDLSAICDCVATVSEGAALLALEREPDVDRLVASAARARVHAALTGATARLDPQRREPRRLGPDDSNDDRAVSRP